MNLKQLRAFTEVIETGSVSEAARRLHRSQPAVSNAIASLEAELDMPLFIRNGMRLHPAPEAHFLLREAKEILGRVDNARRTMQSVRNSEVGMLEIASMPGPTIYLLPKVLNQFLGDRRDIRVRIITFASADVEQLVSAQNVEMGFADYDLLKAYDDDLVSFERYDFECLCAMRADDPLAEKTLITQEDLDGEQLATLYPEHPTTLQTSQAFEARAARMDVVFSARYFAPLFTFIERPGVYALIEAMSVECYLAQQQNGGSRLVFRRFEPRVELRTAILTPNHRPISRLAQQFLDEFRQTLDEIQQTDYTAA